ncbi:MAG: hypothetical protein AAF959_12440 [Cyanobacteria bacterium P01_D01_bin.56]
MVLSRSQSRVPANLPYDLANKILNRLPPEYRRSFTKEQVEVLHTALIMQNALDKDTPGLIKLWNINLGPLRLSLDLRSEQELQVSKRRQSKLVPILCMMVTMLGAGCVAGLLKFRYDYQLNGLATSLQPQEQTVYPAVLPFRKDQANCEKMGATWIDQECVDHNYDPTF